MQGRSWMAALAIAAVAAATLGTASFAGGPTPIKQDVKLFLRFDGVAADGAQVVIKPGHPGCKFKPVTRPVERGNRLLQDIPPIEIETVSADRDCSFAITLMEPGQPDKTVRRNLRIIPIADDKPARPQALSCFISSNALDPSIAAKAAATTQQAVAGKADDTKRKQ